MNIERDGDTTSPVKGGERSYHGSTATSPVKPGERSYHGSTATSPIKRGDRSYHGSESTSPIKAGERSWQDSRTTATGFNRSSSTSFTSFPETPDTDPDADKMVDESEFLPDLTTDNDPYLRAQAYTPDSVLIASPNRPDISIFCSDCTRYIDLRLLNEHKNYHKALEIMKYKAKATPQSTADLIKRRRAVIRKMKKAATVDQPLDPGEVQKVNDAYEFLKADIEDTFEVYRRIVEKGSDVDLSGIALNCSPDCVPAVGICSSANERWKSSMEDTRVFQDYFGNDQHKAFFGIYDGHHGTFASEIAANELHHAVLNEMSKFDPRTKCTCTYNMADSYDISNYEIHSRPTSGMTLSERGIIHEQSTNVIHQIIRTCEEKMEEIQESLDPEGHKSSKSRASKKKEPFAEKMGDAFAKAHKYTDILLSWGKDERSKVRWSGCSSLCCVVQDTPQENPIEENKENEDVKEVKKGPPPLKQLGVLHLSNAGNVKALLVRGNKPYKISRDHTPSNPKEYKRVIKAGGTVNESERELRVNGVLSATRGLGNHGDGNLRKCVIHEPYTTSVPIDQYAQFVILGSNGLWEALEEEDIAKLALQLLPGQQVPPPSSIGSSVMRLIEKSRSPVDDVQSEMSTHRPDTGMDDSTMEASDLAKKTKKPRASTAQSRVTIAEEDEIIDPDTGVVRHSKSKESLHGQDQNDQDIDLLKSISSEKLKNDKNNALNGKNPASNSNLKNDKFLAPYDDLRTEVGSQIDNYSENFTDDLGNEADIDTNTEGLSILQDEAFHVPTKEEIEREFAKGMAERIVQSALLAGARDNITVMVILFPGSGI